VDDYEEELDVVALRKKQASPTLIETDKKQKFAKTETYTLDHGFSDGKLSKRGVVESQKDSSGKIISIQIQNTELNDLK
jgi:hypothetical protein